MNNNDIAILLTLIVIISGVFLSVTFRSNKPKKTSETHDRESEEHRQNNSYFNETGRIQGVNGFVVDPTVFDPKYEEVVSWEPRESNSENDLPIINQPSDSKREIPGVNEYGIDPTVFDFSSIDIGSLDPIDDYHVIGYIAAVAEEEAQAEAEGQNDEDFGGW